MNASCSCGAEAVAEINLGRLSFGPKCLACADAIMKHAGELAPEKDKEKGWAMWLKDSAQWRTTEEEG